MRLIRFLFLIVLVLIAVVLVVPLIVLAGLFVWLKLTEETDDEALELEPEMETATDTASV